SEDGHRILDFSRGPLDDAPRFEKRGLDLQEFETPVQSIASRVCGAFQQERSACAVIGVVESDRGGDAGNVLAAAACPRGGRRRSDDVARLELLRLRETA